ncbi:MAG TPA: hypothetical protein VHF69_05245 [Candidatus Synoicihabitans sp.]|nr:hypothetical protein [Candidatus Synoicihabitans sp.]
MLWLLRLLFAALFVTMTAFFIRAGADRSILTLPAAAAGDRWMEAVLTSAALSCLLGYLWIAWKERSFQARLLWALAIILWGNLPILLYILIELMHVDQSKEISSVIAHRHRGRQGFPATLVVLGLAVHGIAAWPLLT